MAILKNETQVSLFVGEFGSGLDHPECVACGMDGYAYAGGEIGQIYRIDLKNRDYEEFANTGGFVGGIAQDANRNLYACSSGAVMRITPDGKVSPYTTGTPDDPITTPNYPAFDKAGNLYVSDSGEWKLDNGSIYKVGPGGDAEVWCRSLTEFPNGICLNAEEDYLYVVLSLNPPHYPEIP